MDYSEENRITIEDEEAHVPNRLLKDLEEQVKEKENLYLRALADFANYRKRVEREKEKSGKQIRKALLLDFLEIVDNLELAIDYEGEDIVSLKAGIRAIYEQFLDILKRNGVVSLESVGKEFDPRFHEAMSSIETDEFSSGIVSLELRKGYMMEEELLRPSRVQVSRYNREEKGSEVSGLL